MRQGYFATIVLLAGSMTVCGQAPTTGQDRIDRFRGGAIQGVTVTKEDHQEVAYRKGAKAETVPAHLVADVVRSDTPGNLREGRSLFYSGQLADAVAPLSLATREETPWVKEYAQFFLGETFRGLGKSKEAISAYEAVLQVKADSRFLPRVRLAIAAAQSTGGDAVAAQSTLESFIREVDQKRLSRLHVVAARRALGRVLLDSGKPADASREFESALTEAKGLSSKASDEGEKALLATLALRSELERGGALLRDKNPTEAKRIFDRLASDRDPQASIFGRVGLGEWHLAQGNPDAARVQLTEAVALGFEAPDARPRALRLLGEAYLGLRTKQEPGAAEAARLYLDLVAEKYPGSEEAKEARTLRQRLN